MTDEMLSQEQIDALSSGATLGDLGGGGGSAPSATDSSADLSGLQTALGILSEQATTVLSTVLSKEVNVSAAQASPASSDSIKKDYAKDQLNINIQFNKGFQGQFFFVISKKDTAALADLMMMGDGAAEYEEDHKDAIGELLNQVMGAVSTTFGIQFSMECAVTSASVANFDPALSEIPMDQCLSSAVSFKIKDILDSKILLLIPNDLGKAISEKAASKKEPAKPGQEDAAASAGGVTGDLSGASAQLGSFESAPVTSTSSGGVQGGAAATPGNINMLLDIQLQVAIELGRTEMSIKRILELGPGSIIELDRMAGEPVDLLVNGKVVAKGEVVVVDENFGIRIISLVSPEERLKSLK